ncbi:hypothetical protein V497_02046 [Pseudogymnoascus sp. VKM F-4516 (FW-969)]|nr:hypothetical protein V497_02046 [Pseudogymnoascus sp. VKM F-4516 (FW-969)]
MTKDHFTPTYARLVNNTNPSWWKDSCLRWNVFYTLGCMLCPFYLGYDQSLLGGLQAMPYWIDYFDHPKGDRLGLISAALILPAIVMGFPGAWICNEWGRKWCIYIGCIFIIVGAVWNALCRSATEFIVSRVVMGIGGALAKTSAPALLQETAHPRLRSVMGSMYYGSFFLGSFVSGIFCIIGLKIENDWSWRFPCLAAFLGPSFVLLILLKAPESPRFLINKGKHDEALNILAKYHANGDVSDPLVQWEYQEILYALEAEAASSNSYVDFFKTKGNRKRLLVSIAIAIGTNWMGNGVVSYFLSPVLKSVGITTPKLILAINAGLAAWNFIIAEVAGLYAEGFGRRPLFFTSMIGMIFTFSFVMGFSAGFAETGIAGIGIATVPFLFLFFGFYNIAWTPLNYTYCAEIMPFGLRAKGLAIYLAIQQLGGAFNQFVNPIALETIGWKYYGAYIAIDCLYVVLIYFYFPETNKLSIEEVAVIFDFDMKDDRDQAALAFQAQGEKSVVDRTRDS